MFRLNEINLFKVEGERGNSQSKETDIETIASEELVPVFVATTASEKANSHQKSSKRSLKKMSGR